MADEDYRTVDTDDELLEVLGVAGQPAQRIARGHDRIVVHLQLFDNAAPAGGVRERAVYEDDSRLQCSQGRSFIPKENGSRSVRLAFRANRTDQDRIAVWAMCRDGRRLLASTVRTGCPHSTNNGL